MIHHANHLRPARDGLKVGGHQASSASVVTLMTALYFNVLRPADRVAEPGLLLEGRVHGQESVVDRLPGRVDQDLDGAEALVDGVEEAAVPGSQ